MSISHTIFATGCFNDIKATFDSTQGVVATIAGYASGFIENPSYDNTYTLNYGNTEAVLVLFNDSIISFDELIDIYFATINPTTPSKNETIIGTQYCSVIYTADETQESVALNKIRELNESGSYNLPIATHVLPEATFYSTEEYHPKYLSTDKIDSIKETTNTLKGK